MLSTHKKRHFLKNFPHFTATVHNWRCRPKTFNQEMWVHIHVGALYLDVLHLLFRSLSFCFKFCFNFSFLIVPGIFRFETLFDKDESLSKMCPLLRLQSMLQSSVCKQLLKPKPDSIEGIIIHWKLYQC